MRILFAFLILNLALTSCKPTSNKQDAPVEEPQGIEVPAESPKKSAPSPTTSSSPSYDGISEATTAQDGSWRDPSDDEIREYGIIKQIEDGPYPMFVVTMEFPERQMTSDFNLNIEEVDITAEELSGAVGKYASVYYLSEEKNMLHDIQYGGTSLYGEYAPDLDPDWMKITGLLNGADEVTGGDLPDQISIKDDQGVQLYFDEYITEEEVAVNGKEVTGYYSVRGTETITFLVIAEE